MKKLLFILLVSCIPVFAQLGTTAPFRFPIMYNGNGAPGAVAGNLPNDLYSDNVGHNMYWCAANYSSFPFTTAYPLSVTAFASPACTTVAVGQWECTTCGSVSGTVPPQNGGTGIVNNSAATLTLGTSAINFATMGTGLPWFTITSAAVRLAVSLDIAGMFGCANSTSVFPNGAGTCSTPSGGGTVTVSGSGNLTNNAIMTGAGTTVAQTSATTATLTSSALTMPVASTFSAAGAASTPGLTVSGAPFSGGSATTTKPQFSVDNCGATSNAWSTNGTEFGVCIASGFTGNLEDLQLNGGSKWSVNYLGSAILAGGTGTLTLGGIRGSAVNTQVIVQSQGANIAETSVLMADGSYTNSTGLVVPVKIQPTINQTSTASTTVLDIAPIETATGSGTQYLLTGHAGSAGTTLEFWIDHLGNSQFNNSTINGTANFTSTFEIAGNAMTFPAAAATLTQTIAYGTVLMPTAAIASGACGSAGTVTTVGGTLANVLTTDRPSWSFSGGTDPTTITGYGVSATGAVLTIYPYPTAGGITIKACNSTASSITPSAITLNWGDTR